MTTLGKILVIVNFLFSVVTGALIIMVFVTRTNWKAGFDEINTQNQVLKAERNSYVAAIDDIKNKHQGELNNLKNQLAQANNAAAKATQDAKDANSQKELIAKNFESEKANHAKDLEELKRRQAEVENITKAAAAKDDKINGLEKDNGDFRNRAVAAEINFKAEHERNARLLDQLEKLAKDNERLQQQAKGGGIIAGAPPKKAPPDDVKGSVVEIDAKSGLLTISIGSDSGINVGHTLEVYHLEPNPEYLGSIKIVDVHFKQAVARAVLPLKTEKLRKGDVVASRIVALR
jgi:hypothetical protein